MIVEPELVARFQADLATVWPHAGDADRRLGLAVSGGGDSLALLLLAGAALPGRIEAATVDHQLRQESAAEAAYVAALCRELGVPHRTIPVEVGRGNLQDRARAARYDGLAGWCSERGLAALATAHQMDDQAETVLMRLNRGSGVSGLAAIRAAQLVPNTAIALVRPFLGWRRESLAKVVRDTGWDAVADPSNDDTRFDRVRMRQILRGVDWLDIAAVARSAQLLAQADEALLWAVGEEVARHIRFESETAIYAARASTAPALIRTGAIRRIYRHFGHSLDPAAAAQVVGRLAAGEAGNVAGLQFTAHAEEWVFRPENPRRTG